jgi:[ribosomal protein S5]-alanine N-acetyltransferase
MSLHASTITFHGTWRQQLPVLAGFDVSLREVRASDAPALFALLTSDEVSRFMSPPPSTLEGFERFVAWAQSQRAAGAYMCFAVTLKGFDTPIGLFQIHRFEGDPSTAEWGFAIGSPFWGSGVFQQGAELVIDFAFNVLKINRLEARTAVHNGRGLRALQKIGAMEEGILRRSFLRNGEYLDQVLCTIVRGDRRSVRCVIH